MVHKARGDLSGFFSAGITVRNLLQNRKMGMSEGLNAEKETKASQSQWFIHVQNHSGRQHRKSAGGCEADRGVHQDEATSPHPGD